MSTPYDAARAAALEVLHYTARGPCGARTRTAGWGYAEPYTRDWMTCSVQYPASSVRPMRIADRRWYIWVAPADVNRQSVQS